MIDHHTLHRVERVWVVLSSCERNCSSNWLTTISATTTYSFLLMVLNASSCCPKLFQCRFVTFRQLVEKTCAIALITTLGQRWSLTIVSMGLSCVIIVCCCFVFAVTMTVGLTREFALKLLLGLSPSCSYISIQTLQFFGFEGFVKLFL